MKATCFFVISLLFYCHALAQIKTEPVQKTVQLNKNVSTVKIIPAGRAMVARKGMGDLKFQLLQLQDSVTKSKTEIDLLVNEYKDKMDSMSEMSEMESLRLQMAMDRINKMISNLSNIKKKISDTRQSITQNLK